MKIHVGSFEPGHGLVAVEGGHYSQTSRYQVKTGDRVGDAGYEFSDHCF